MKQFKVSTKKYKGSKHPNESRLHTVEWANIQMIQENICIFFDKNPTMKTRGVKHPNQAMKHPDIL